MEVHEALKILEALLFASEAPLELHRIQEVLELDAAEARALMEALTLRYDQAGSGLQIVEVGGGFRICTRSELAPWLLKLQRSRTRSRFSKPALETLSIIAYRQPISRAEVEALRGVNVEAVVATLLERRLVKVVGRRPTPGRPLLYGTTREFLTHFGLRDLDELPRLEEERAAEDRLQTLLTAAGGREAEGAGAAASEAPAGGGDQPE
jgi:segregation and condensation protein B